MRNKTFHTGVSVHAWAICVFTSQTLIREDVLRCVGARVSHLARTHERSSCRSFVTSLQRISHEAGMPITTSPGFCKYSVGVEQVEPMFKFIMQTLPQIQLILVILPGKSPVYGERAQ
jgi:eukaryotic translation initiation factor 2C